MAEPWLSVEETAVNPGITEDSVCDWIADKKLPAYPFGPPCNPKRRQINEWMGSNKTARDAENKGGAA